MSVEGKAQKYEGFCWVSATTRYALVNLGVFVYYLMKINKADYGSIKGRKIITASACINDSYLP